MNNMVKQIADIFARMVAVFVISALGVLGAGAIAGVEVLQAVLMAGLLGVARVLEDLAKSFLQDGKLTQAEINAAFRKEHSRAEEEKQ
jgi:hypothetical protein